MNKYKLDFSKYVFTINNNDLTDAVVEYGFNTYKSNISDNNITIRFGNNDSFISFGINDSLDNLNQLDNIPLNITNKISSFDLIINNNEYDLYIPSNTIEDMYHNLSSFYIMKKDNNVFMFKISIPDKNLFTFFEIDFNKK